LILVVVVIIAANNGTIVHTVVVAVVAVAVPINNYISADNTVHIPTLERGWNVCGCWYPIAQPISRNL